MKKIKNALLICIFIAGLASCEEKEPQVIDSTPPEVTLHTPANDVQVKIDSTLEVTGAAYDQHEIKFISLLIDGKEVKTQLSNTFSYNLKLTDLPGVHNLQLLASDEFDNTGLSNIAKINVFLNSPPEAHFHISQDTVKMGQTIHFDASSSSDRDTPSANLLYKWDFDNDGRWDKGPDHETSATYSYENYGIETVVLSVSDPDGDEGIYESQVCIKPMASASVSESYYMRGFEITFECPRDWNLEYRWDYENDGIWNTGFDSNNIGKHAYSKVGTHSYRVEVKSDEGLTDTYVGQVEIIKGEMSVFKTVNSPLPSENIRGLAGHENTLWIATTGGLVQKEADDWSVYTEDNSGLPGNSFYMAENGLKVDLDGSVWMVHGPTSNGYGLVHFDPSNSEWEVFTRYNSALVGNIVNSVEITPDGTKWVGAENQILKIDETGWTSIYQLAGGIEFSRVFSILNDKDGNIWAANFRGLLKYDGQDWRIYNSSNSKLPEDACFDVKEDIHGHLWVANRYHLAFFNGSTFTIYNGGNSPLPSHKGNLYISSLTCDKSGKLWICDYHSGLTVFDGENWISYNSRNSPLPTDWINCIHVDEDGIKWIGTTEGLIRFDDSY